MMEPWMSKLIGFFVLAKCFSVASIIMFCYWAMNYGGGFNGIYSFNCHPLLMIIGFVFIYGDGLLTYKLIQTPNRSLVKIVHCLINLAVLVVVTIGLTPVFKDTPNKLYSLHSWIGICTVIIYAAQWVLGFVTFLLPGLSMTTRAWYKPIHTYTGMALFVMATAAIVTGLTSMTSKNDNYSSHSNSGILFNMIGVMCICCVATTLYIATSDSFVRPLTGEEEHIVLEKK